jgi:hypothetical protein
MKFFSFLVLSIYSVWGLAKSLEPKLIEKKDVWTLEIPVEMQTILKKEKPNFVPKTSADFTSPGEFRKNYGGEHSAFKELYQQCGATKEHSFFAAIGDFNGDGKKDLALIGNNGPANIEVIALVSVGSTYQLYEVSKLRTYYGAFLCKGRAKAKKITTCRDGEGEERFLDHPFVAKGDYIELVDINGGSNSYYLNAGKFCDVFGND